MQESQTNTSQSPCFTESIKAASHVLTLFEANIKKEEDIFSRQVSISRNYVWIASLFLAVLFAIFDKSFPNGNVISQLSGLTILRCSLLAIASITATTTFYVASKVSFNSLDSRYLHATLELFQNDDGQCYPTPKEDKAIYYHYIRSILTANAVYSLLDRESVRRGKILTLAEKLMQASYILLILNLIIFLEKYL